MYTINQVKLHTDFSMFADWFLTLKVANPSNRQVPT